jgi:small subunit ribosomal protein S3
MSHKTHPKILQIKEIKDWLSRGYYEKKFPQYLEEDFKIREFLQKKLPQGAIEAIEIERSQTLLKIIIKTARPALVIGRGGAGVEELKKGVERILGKIKKDSSTPKKDIKIEIVEVKNPWTSASLVSQWVASQLEKRVPYRRALKMALSRVMEQKEVKGAKIMVSGRLNGIEIARTEWLQQGKLPRQTVRSVIDYGFSQAFCTYGVIGVKVWIYKGEKFE